MILVTLYDQIAAARREVALRKNVYATRICEGKMTLEEATKEYCNALAILKTLEDIAKRDDWELEAGWYFDKSIEEMLRKAAGGSQ
ncbi:MAG: hypothetical protein N2Z75_10815 [Meiothermus sp.]|nr:hypothetical protein [Meiothermus sp.]